MKPCERRFANACDLFYMTDVLAPDDLTEDEKCQVQLEDAWEGQDVRGE